MDGQEAGCFDDDDPLPPLLPPEDRLWRHPSELAAIGALTLAPNRALPPIRLMITLAAVTGVTVLFLALRPGSTGSLSHSASLASFSTPTLPTMAVETTALAAPLVAPGHPPDPSSRRSQTVLRAIDGSTELPAVVMDSQHVMVAIDQIPEAGGWLVVTSDGRMRRATFVGHQAQTRLAVAAVDQPLDIGPTHATLRVGETIEAGTHSGPVVADHTPHKADGLLLESAAVAKIPGVTLGDVFTHDGVVVAIAVAVDGQEVSVMPVQLALAAGEAIVARHPLAWLGISARHDDDGLVVTAVTTDSPAQTIGLRPGDVIHRLDNVAITTATDLVATIWRCGPERQTVISLNRDGRDMELRGSLAELPAAA